MSGEAGFVTDTNTLKIGNGATAFASLDEIGGGGTSGGIAETFETVAKNLDASNATLNYTGSDLTRVVYASGITKTLGYSGGNLTTVTLSGSTPGGIDLVKTLSYTGADLTGVAYS
jgi:hypothetical protein